MTDASVKDGGMTVRMEHPQVRKSSLMMRRLILLSALVCIVSARPVHASYQIGQFFNDGGSGITWTDNGSNTGGTLTGTETGYFTFTNMSGLLTNPAMNGAVEPATMTITDSTVTDGFTAGNQLNQPLSGTLTVAITSGGQNLLTATVTTGPPLLAGTGSAAALVSATPRDNVTYTSDFFNPAALTNQGFSIPLVGVTPTLSFNTTGGHNFLNSFQASASAIFSANAVAVPEPASLGLLGIGCVSVLGLRRRFGRRTA